MVQEIDDGHVPNTADTGVDGAEMETVEPGTAGERLRAAREAKGLSIAQIAAETRIPQRHLHTVEAGDFANLPARTYAVGFARTYAKTVGLDPNEIVAQVHLEMGFEDANDQRASRDGKLEPGDPARVPSRGLALLSVLAIALLLSGGFLFYRTYFIAGEGPGSLLTAEQQREAAAAALEERLAARGEGTTQDGSAAVAGAGGPVVFTALENDTWVKFYDANGDQLMQKQMAKGESYTVPADAVGPQVWTGRPLSLAITVGGRAVPKLSAKDEIIRDIPVTAAALLARNRSAGPPAAGATTQSDSRIGADQDANPATRSETARPAT